MWQLFLGHSVVVSKMALHIIIFFKVMFSCKILECFVMSGQYSSTCYDILHEYSSNTLLSLHSPTVNYKLSSRSIKNLSKTHTCIVIMHNTLWPVQGAPIKTIPHNSLQPLQVVPIKNQYILNFSVFQHRITDLNQTFGMIWFNRYNTLKFTFSNWNQMCHTHYIHWMTFCEKTANLVL